MPIMSTVERAFCPSPPWRAFAQDVVLPWAVQGIDLQGDLLELGSGSGDMAEGTSLLFPQTRQTVTDLDVDMVDAARRRLARRPGIEVRQADVTALPFTDSSFDFVATYLMLHHVVAWP